MQTTDEEFISAVKSSFSIREVLSKLSLVPAGGNYKTFHGKVKRLGLDISHFTGQGHLKGKTHNWNKKIPLTDILKNGVFYTTSLLRTRLVKDGMLENKCSKCGIEKWLNEPISLHLDHIDGNNSNNELSNLRILCPNCHSQTETYCVKNRKKLVGAKIYNCEICNKELTEKRKSNRCITCREVGSAGGTRTHNP